MNTVAVAALDLLAAVVDALTDPPDRQAVAAGNATAISHDFGCPSVLVTVDRIRAEVTGSGQQCHVRPAADLSVTVLRCETESTPEPTSEDALEADFTQQTDDAVALWRAVFAAGGFKSSLGTCAEVTAGAIEPIGPAGTQFGVRWQISVRFDSLAPAGS